MSDYTTYDNDEYHTRVGLIILIVASVMVCLSISASIGFLIFYRQGQDDAQGSVQVAPGAPVVLMSSGAPAQAPKKKKKQKKRSRDVEQGSNKEKKEELPEIHIHLPPEHQEASGTPEPSAPSPSPALSPPPPPAPAAPAPKPPNRSDYYNLGGATQVSKNL